MENNYNNKSKFFAQYIFQDVLMDFVPELNEYKKQKIYPSDCHIYDMNSVNFLELKPIESISDDEKLNFIQYYNRKNYEELIELEEAGRRILIKQYDETIYRARLNEYAYSDFQRYYADWFRFNGFACEWMKLKIDDLIKYKWVVLSAI